MIPLSLYIHIPWCVQKCPYCDFNSHQQKGIIPEQEYLAHLLNDLEQDLRDFNINTEKRSISSIFIGGGTPSLLSVEAMDKLLNGVRERVKVHPKAEITMEANPGTVEADKFKGFKEAGINRISIGVQSFQAQHLSALGRIHDAKQAQAAISFARDLTLRSFNTDIMHGLPNQSITNALLDLQCSIDLQAPHISWYQLTIEPNTQFYSKPPVLPEDDVLWDIQCKGQDLLAQHAYHQYEISAYAKEEHPCQHNINYWRFGDYLGIGCGAHGKITNSQTREIRRTVKVKHPRGYMELSKPYLYASSTIKNDELAFEFFMNRFRLLEQCPKEHFEVYCGRKITASEQAQINLLEQQGLLIVSQNTWQVSELGRRYLNSILEKFV